MRYIFADTHKLSVKRTLVSLLNAVIKEINDKSMLFDKKIFLTFENGCQFYPVSRDI